LRICAVGGHHSLGAWVQLKPQGKALTGAGKRIREPMKRYSAFAIARESLRNHLGWDRAWASPEPRARYDVVIVGAGGHGLATAYYLGKNFGITNHPVELFAGPLCRDL
jgi:hypothetical protein